MRAPRRQKPVLIAEDGLQRGKVRTGMAWEVLYPSGSVPRLERLQAAFNAVGDDESRMPALSCQRLVNPASGYPTIECMVGGLGFDIAAIGVWNREEHAAIEHCFDVEPDTFFNRAGLTIVPGPDIANMAHAMPVVRAGAMLVRRIIDFKSPLAIVWRPIGSAMEPGYFRRVVDAWLAGGPFPSLGMVGLRSAPDGGLHSHGLALFTGQELRLDPAIAEAGSEGWALAARLIDRLVESDAVQSPLELSGEGGRTIRLAPSANGRFVVVEWSE